jgi:lipoprotein-anchoring transpeptidase ErfK/SrfK
MKPSVKAALLIILLAAVALIGYALGRRQPPATPSVAAVSPAPAATPPAPLPQPTSASPARAQLEKAAALKDAGKLAEARDAFRKLLEKPTDNGVAEDARKHLGEINLKLLLTLAPAPEKVDYVVVPGDSLARIAKNFTTTVEVVVKANNLRESVIQPGQRLRITPTKFAVSVNKTDNTLTVADDGKFFKRYRVGTGQHSTTPTGAFKLTERIPNPPWWKDGRTIPFGDNENILGTHWIALDIPHYGIHGTWEPETIGHQSSQGCIRLLNDDVEELFTILPVGTPIEIKD